MPTRIRRPRLLEQLRLALRVRHYSPRTEEAYVAWVRRYVRFHGMRHPGDLGREEIGQFFTALAGRAERQQPDPGAERADLSVSRGPERRSWRHQ